MKLSTYRTDPEAEKSGRWFNWLEDSQLLIARANNPKFQAAFQSELEPHAEQLRNAEKGSPLQEEVSDRAMLAGLSKGVLLGWKSLNDDDGSPIPFSVEKATELLVQYTDLRQFVINVSSRSANYSLRLQEASSGN